MTTDGQPPSRSNTKPKTCNSKLAAKVEIVEDALQAAWGKVEAIVNTLTFSKGFEIPLLSIDATATPEREITF